MVGKVWSWLNGKKLVLGAIITIVSSIVAGLPVILPLFIQDAAQIAQITGVALAIVGALHKAYKFIYKEDHA